MLLMRVEVRILDYMQYNIALAKATRRTEGSALTKFRGDKPISFLVEAGKGRWKIYSFIHEH